MILPDNRSRNLNQPSGRARHARGLSLIEILVAMALGLVVLAGATNLFLGSSRTFGANESLSRMQEDARFALSTLERDGRAAGYVGCSPNVRNQIDSTDPFWTNTRGTVIGWENAGTGVGDTLDLTVAGNQWSSSSGRGVPGAINALPGNDIIEIRTGRTATDVQPNLVSVSNNQASIGLNGVQLNRDAGAVLTIVSGDCGFADRFRRGNNSTANTVNLQVSGSMAPDNSTFEFAQSYDAAGTFIIHTTTVYFIGTGASGQPALMSLDTSMPGATTTELVEGVETMQVLYGVAPNANSTQASAYVAADAVGDWDNVVSVRIGMLLRSSQPLNTGEPNRRLFNLMGTTINPTGGNIAAPTGDQNLRLVATKTISLRNRLR